MTNYYSHFKKAAFVSLLCFLYLTNQSLGQSQSYLNGLPTRNDIISKIRGDNPKETYGKQIAALKFMCDVVMLHQLEKEPKLERTAKEISLYNEYNSWGRLIDEYSTNVESLEGSKRREFEVYAHNLNNKELKTYVVNNLFNIEARNRYEEVKKVNDQKVKDRKVVREQEKEYKEQQELEKVASEENKKNKKYKFYFGIFLMIVPFTVYAFWRGKRKFERRNRHGVEEFDSYGKLVKANFFEEFAWIIVAILMLAGLWLMLLGT